MRITFLFFLIFHGTIVFSQPVSLNSKSLKNKDGKFSFLVAGHLYGSSSHYSGLPASTFLNNIDSFNRMDLDFMVSTGDLYQNPKLDKFNYKEWFLERLSFPIYNSVGNHDIIDDTTINYFSFTYSKNLFIILDTEKSNGNIEGDQLAFFKASLEFQAKSIFIFSHRPIWSSGYEDLKNLFKGGSKSLFEVNFRDVIKPLLESLNSDVYWFSGSMGDIAHPFFYTKKEPFGITYIQTAIKDRPNDGILIVNVENQIVSFKPVGLLNHLIEPLDNYGLSRMKQNKINSINLRNELLKLYFFCFDKKFIFGVLFTVFFCSFFSFIKKTYHI